MIPEIDAIMPIIQLPDQPMKIYSWNVNSLRSCEEKFLRFLSDYQPDVVGIQELRAHPDQLSFFLKAVPGYECIFNDSGRPGYAGTAMYFKSDLPVTKLTKTLENPVLDKEGRVILLHTGDTYIYNFYTPNGNSSPERLAYKLQYYEEILTLARVLNSQHAKVIISGDLNVAHTHLDLYLKSSNLSGFLPEERQWFTDLLTSGYHDSFRMFVKEGGYYSWWNLKDKERKQNDGWRFDYLLVSDALKPQVKGAGILKNVYGSDHCPVWVEI